MSTESLNTEILGDQFSNRADRLLGFARDGHAVDLHVEPAAHSERRT